jgi:hypothetical protein
MAGFQRVTNIIILGIRSESAFRRDRKWILLTFPMPMLPFIARSFAPKSVEAYRLLFARLRHGVHKDLVQRCLRTSFVQDPVTRTTNNL